MVSSIKLTEYDVLFSNRYLIRAPAAKLDLWDQICVSILDAMLSLDGFIGLNYVALVLK